MPPSVSFNPLAALNPSRNQTCTCCAPAHLFSEKNMSKRKGFTLIELLVVVAIIAVLMAILLPSLGRAKANAMRVKCGARLKQWALAINIYAQEYDNWILEKDPAGNTWASVGATSVAYYGPELSAGTPGAMKQLWRACPAFPTPSAVTYAFMAGLDAKFDGSAGTITRFWKSTQVTRPAMTLLMCDAASNSGTEAVSINTTLQTSSRDTKGFLQQYHLGKGNAVFQDGHVEAVTWDDYLNNLPATTSPTASEAGKRWSQLQ
jgi:prepilin-type N-terminal cleavage/methylation domain-containing protein/prepilin-type processing-associated H-X9-DG protein